jgi:hypothetical protein
MWRSVRVVRRLLHLQTFGRREHDRGARGGGVEGAHDEVKRVCTAERLLVYEVKQGWEPLCRFLEVPVPETPFPHVNDAESFQQNMRQRLRKGAFKVS